MPIKPLQIPKIKSDIFMISWNSSNFYLGVQKVSKVDCLLQCGVLVSQRIHDLPLGGAPNFMTKCPISLGNALFFLLFEVMRGKMEKIAVWSKICPVFGTRWSIFCTSFGRIFWRDPQGCNPLEKNILLKFKTKFGCLMNFSQRLHPFTEILM